MAGANQLVRWRAAVAWAPGRLGVQPGWAQDHAMANVHVRRRSAPARRVGVRGLHAAPPTRAGLPVSQAMAQAAERHRQRAELGPGGGEQDALLSPLAASVAGASLGAVAGLLMYVLWQPHSKHPPHACGYRAIVPSCGVHPTLGSAHVCVRVALCCVRRSRAPCPCPPCPACVRACVCACVCVRACVRACACTCHTRKHPVCLITITRFMT